MLAFIGTLPPPVHGMAVVTKAVLDRVTAKGGATLVIDMSASSLRRSLWGRLSRLPRFLSGLLRFGSATSDAMYMSISGGMGQLYDIAFIVVARMKRVPMFLHHHNFGYVEKYSSITHLLTWLAGPSTRHVVQSTRMGELLESQYGLMRCTIGLSNVGILCDENPPILRSRLHTIGFLSNVSKEKGIFTFLELMGALRGASIDVQGVVAGPFQDKGTERAVLEMLRALPNVRYVGPKYGAEKREFYECIDAFVLPTMFEAEGLVNLEAMSFGVPVIASARGCIPEIVEGSGGLVIATHEDFVSKALQQILDWSVDAELFKRCSGGARDRFIQLLESSARHWDEFIQLLVWPSHCDSSAVSAAEAMECGDD